VVRIGVSVRIIRVKVRVSVFFELGFLVRLLRTELVLELGFMVMVRI